MKKIRGNCKGFALVETLIGSMFVVAIFIVLFENYYPIVGKYERYENYDDLDSKYIAHYLREMIQVDPNKSVILNKLGSESFYLFEETDSDEDIKTTSTPNELCKMLSLKETFNNKQYCQNFIGEASISRIFLIDYNTAKFKDTVKNHTDEDEFEVSRALELYADYIPTYVNSASSKPNYKRLIVEIKHDNVSSDREGDFYYTYANIEVH